MPGVADTKSKSDEREHRVTDPRGDTEPVLGRTLAETAVLNSREHRAGRRAAAAVRTPSRPHRRRHLRRGWLWFAAVIAAVFLVALALEIAGR